METTRLAYIVPVLTLFFGALILALALTGLRLAMDRSECAANGGTYGIEGGTAWCRY